MEQLNLDNFNLIIPNTHYKNLKTEVIEEKSKKHSMEKLDYGKINCSTKDLLKEKDKKIEILQEQMLQLQKKLEQQKPNKNYKPFNQNNNSNSANNINYSNLNFNTSTNFPLKSEIKKIWEEFALVSLLDNFIDYENQPEIIFHLVSEVFLITEKLISELCLDIYQKISQSLNIINDKNFINDIEKTSRPLIKEHLNKTFAGTNNQQFIDKVINLFNNSAKKIMGDERENSEKIQEIVGGTDFKLMIKKIKDIILFTKFNDQQLYFKIEKDFNKRLVEKIKIKNNYEKKNYLIINDNNKEDINGVIILKPPVLKSGFPLNNDFKTIIILYEKEGNIKSYKNIVNINNNENANDNRKNNKILDVKIKKILPKNKLKNQHNNIEIKVDEYNSYISSNKQENNRHLKRDFHNEEIINTVFTKEQRNSYQILSNNINLKSKLKEEKINLKTDLNIKENKNQNEYINKESNIINNYENEEKNMIIIKNNFDENNQSKNKNNDKHLSEKRNINNKKKHRPQLSDQILKNNSSKNIFDYMHKDLLNSSSSKKYQNLTKDINNSFNQNHFITYNNYEVNRNISLNYSSDHEEEEDNKNEKEIIFHNNTAKEVFNVPDNYKKKNIKDFDEEEIKNKILRNTNNNQKIIKLNQIFFNPNEKNTILKNQGNTINYNQLKGKFKNSLNKLNAKNVSKNFQNLRINNNKNYKKILKSTNNNNQKKKNIINYYKTNNVYEGTDFNNNEYYNQLRITAVDMYNSNLIHPKIDNNNIYTKNNNKTNNKINHNNNNKYEHEQELVLFKKYKTTNLISNKIKNNFNKITKKNCKIIPMVKMKTHQNQYNANNNNNKEQNRKSSIKNNQILFDYSNSVTDNYRKIIRKNNNINNFIMDNNNLMSFHSKKKINFDNKNKNKNETNIIINEGNNIENIENDQRNNILKSDKYNNYLLKQNKNKNKNKSLNKDKKYIKEILYPDIRDNNLIENNFYDINNTGYKIKNLNINYFNIIQPNKLYIDQNSIRSKSRPSDCERNKILINYNNFNKNIIKNLNHNNINYKINENNINNNKLIFNKVNNLKKKNSSQENSNRINLNNNLPNNRLNKNNKKHNKLNLVKNNTNNKMDNYNLAKNPLRIISDLTNIEKITEQIKNEKRVLIKIKGHKNINKVSRAKEEQIRSENDNNDNIYIINNNEKNCLTIEDINNQSSNDTSRKKNKYHIMNNKHISYVKIPKKANNNEVRPASGGVRYIEKYYNKFNSEYINQMSNNLNNKEINDLRSSYNLIEKERRNNNKNNIEINNQNNIKFNDSNNYDNKNINYENDNRKIFNKKINKNINELNIMTTYNYNSFRKNKK